MNVVTHNFMDLMYNLPKPILILAAAILVIVVFGVFSHIRDVARGKAGVMDYVILAAMLLVGILIVAVAFKVF